MEMSMSKVSASDIADMKRLRAILNGDSEVINPPNANPTSQQTQRARAVATKNGVDKGMDNFKNIVDNFYKVAAPMEGAASHAVKQLLNESMSDVDVREALETEKTNSGIKIGKWEILIKEEGKGKRYDVVFLPSETVIANNLCLYEAAYALVRYLNSGKTINSDEVKQVLDLEEKYYSHRRDAYRFRKLSEKCFDSGDGAKGQIYESRMEYSKELSDKAKSELSKLKQGLI
jgi:hypothetical protein